MSELDERVQRYLAGELTPEERIAFEDEVLANSELSDRLYADANVRAALETAAHARRERSVAAASVDPWWRRHVWRWMVPAVGVAAVAIFMFVQQTESPEQAPVFRGADRHFAAIEPAGDIESVPSQFVWSASDGAAYYRFELFDAASALVLETVTSDTMITIDLATIAVPTEGYWVVTPLNDVRVGAGDAIISQYKTAE
jgi:hypothetical protein